MGRIIAVMGATGNQGGSVARSPCQNPSFEVRAITRDPGSAASQPLAASGIQVVQVDAFDRTQMLAAFEGCWGSFVNLNSDDKVWRRPGGPSEFEVSKMVLDAAAEAGVEHLVYSSGPPCVQMTGGRVRMNAMEMKYQTEQYARRACSFKTLTPINPAWFLENFLSKEVAPVFGGFPHFVDGDGYLTLRVPNWGGDEQVPFVSIGNDFGDIVHGILLDPQRWNGHVVHGASFMRDFGRLVGDFEAVTGNKARFEPVLPSWEAFDTRGIPELDDVKLMFALTQATGGRYFGPEPSETHTAAELKKATAAALGKEAGLVDAKQWFGKHWAADGG